MTIDEATKLLKMSDQAIWLKGLEKEQKEAKEMAIKSLEAWEKVKIEIDEATEMLPDGDFYIKNLDVKRIFDKHLSEVSE